MKPNPMLFFAINTNGLKYKFESLIFVSIVYFQVIIDRSQPMSSAVERSKVSTSV